MLNSQRKSRCPMSCKAANRSGCDGVRWCGEGRGCTIDPSSEFGDRDRDQGGPCRTGAGQVPSVTNRIRDNGCGLQEQRVSKKYLSAIVKFRQRSKPANSSRQLVCLMGTPIAVCSFDAEKRLEVILFAALVSTKHFFKSGATNG